MAKDCIRDALVQWKEFFIDVYYYLEGLFFWGFTSVKQETLENTNISQLQKHDNMASISPNVCCREAKLPWSFPPSGFPLERLKNSGKVLQDTI